MKLKVLFVFNHTIWTTISFKLEQIKTFFSSKIELSIDTKYTNFTNIPFEKINVLDGTGNQNGVDMQALTETVQDKWLDQNIVTPLGTGYDIVVFCITDNDKQGHMVSAGIRGDRDQGPVECIIFGGEEFSNTYVNMVSQGNNFVVFSCHEISHAIYMILGKPDNTHMYFYSGHPGNVLEDFVSPIPNLAEKINALQRVINYCLRLLGIYQQQQNMYKPLSEIELPKDKIKEFCLAIQEREGYIAPCPQYPKGTTAWRNNNPGNAKYVGQRNATGRDSLGFAIFPSYQVGFDYLYKVIENTCKGLSTVRGANYTINEFFIGTLAKNYRDGYAPKSDNNDPYSYAIFVANKVGVPTSTTMKELL